MRVVKLDIYGISQKFAEAKRFGERLAFALVAGERGRGRWEYIIPVAASVAVPANIDDSFDTTNIHFSLKNLNRKDPAGNDMYLLINGKRDDSFLVFWNLSPGFRGGATYTVSGNAIVIGEGEEAQGLAGRMGGAKCPVVLVSGPCVLEWKRTGRLYGQPSHYVASFDGVSWNVGPKEEIELAAEIFEN
jgi:hypothetical protein